MTDLTAITTPFGLLDRETAKLLDQSEALHDIEVYSDSGWVDADPKRNGWCPVYAYRVKPAPPKPREWWLERDEPSGLVSHVHLEPPEKMDGRNELIHVREVLE